MSSNSTGSERSGDEKAAKSSTGLSISSESEGSNSSTDDIFEVLIIRFDCLISLFGFRCSGLEDEYLERRNLISNVSPSCSVKYLLFACYNSVSWSMLGKVIFAA